MRGPQGRGSPTERAVAAVLRDLDYLVGSLRHTGGAGDLLAHHRQKRGLLVEVKATTDLPWRSSFGPDKRAEMIEAGVYFGVEPILAWWPPRLGLVWLSVEDWPE